jgi:hypothetical protein
LRGLQGSVAALALLPAPGGAAAAAGGEGEGTASSGAGSSGGILTHAFASFMSWIKVWHVHVAAL